MHVGGWLTTQGDLTWGVFAVVRLRESDRGRHPFPQHGAPRRARWELRGPPPGRLAPRGQQQEERAEGGGQGAGGRPDPLRHHARELGAPLGVHRLPPPLQPPRCHPAEVWLPVRGCQVVRALRAAVHRRGEDGPSALGLGQPGHQPPESRHCVWGPHMPHCRHDPGTRRPEALRAGPCAHTATRGQQLRRRLQLTRRHLEVRPGQLQFAGGAVRDAPLHGGGILRCHPDFRPLLATGPFGCPWECAFPGSERRDGRQRAPEGVC